VEMSHFHWRFSGLRVRSGRFAAREQGKARHPVQFIDRRSDDSLALPVARSRPGHALRRNMCAAPPSRRVSRTNTLAA
jgi:hypothetical protein